MAAATSPQVIMIRAIQRRAPNRSSSRLLGTSKMKYARKNSPAPNPNTVGDRCRSWLRSCPAKPRFTRSMKAMK